MNYNSTMSYRRRSSKSTSAKIVMFIVCILIITIGVLKYLKSQEEDVSTTDNSAFSSSPAMTLDSINSVVSNPVVQNNQPPIVNPNVVNTPALPNTPTLPNTPALPNAENSSLKLDALSQDKEIVIKDGDSLWKICCSEYKNGSYCDKIVAYNKVKYNNIVNPKHLKKNDVIYLPPISYFKTESKQTTKTQVAKITQPKTQVSKQDKPQAKEANDKIYEIQRGDNFSSISQKEYQTPKYANAILNYNNSVYHLNLNEKKLQIKTKIYLPPKGYFSNNETIHIIKANETLDKISRQHYKTSKYAIALQKYNHIKDTSKLQIGQEILIPPLATLEKKETGKSQNRGNIGKSNSNKSDLENLSNYQLVCVKKSTNTWDSLAKCYQISKSKLIECNNGLYTLYPKIIPETSQIKIPIQITQRKSL